MCVRYPLFQIESVPGEPPRASEQLNGDLLLPACGRTLLERALVLAERALAEDHQQALEAIADARRLLGIVKVDTDQERLHGQLLVVREV